MKFECIGAVSMRPLPLKHPAFAIPVFRTPQSNRIFAQELDQRRRVTSFVKIDTDRYYPIYTLEFRFELCVGDIGVGAVIFDGDNLLIATTNDLKAVLSSKKFHDATSLFYIDASMFLGQRESKIDYSRGPLAKIAGKRWRDLERSVVRRGRRPNEKSATIQNPPFYADAADQFFSWKADLDGLSGVEKRRFLENTIEDIAFGRSPLKFSLAVIDFMYRADLDEVEISELDQACELRLTRSEWIRDEFDWGTLLRIMYDHGRKFRSTTFLEHYLAAREPPVSYHERLWYDVIAILWRDNWRWVKRFLQTSKLSATNKDFIADALTKGIDPFSQPSDELQFIIDWVKGCPKKNTKWVNAIKRLIEIHPRDDVIYIALDWLAKNNGMRSGWPSLYRTVVGVAGESDDLLGLARRWILTTAARPSELWARFTLEIAERLRDDREVAAARHAATEFIARSGRKRMRK